MILWLIAGASGGVCTFTVDGVPAERLDCTSGGAWRVSCELPEGRSGKVRMRLVAEGRDLEAEARVPMAAGAVQETSLMGPGGRAGGFLVDKASAGLLPGQAVGPIQLCPIVQPGVVPGSPRVELPVEVRVTEHAQVGFGEELLDGGVVNRVPVYDAGTLVASGRALIVQHPVKDVAMLEGVVPLARDLPVRGQLSLAADDGTWRTVAWTGSLRDVEVDTGDLVVLTIDFVEPEIRAALGGPPLAGLQSDLELWLAGDDSSRLGLVAWDRSELRRPRTVSFAETRSERRGDFEQGQIRLSVIKERLRVVIAHRAAALDAPSRAALDQAARAGLD